MGKGSKSGKDNVEQKKKSKKRVQISKMNSSDDEEVDDVMAWGRKK